MKLLQFCPQIVCLDAWELEAADGKRVEGGTINIMSV
jgi:hypothetical protein